MSKKIKLTDEQREDARRRDKYPCIVRWGRELGSYAYYIDNQTAQAEADKAPATAIYKRDDGTWATAEGIADESRRNRILGEAS